MKTKSHALKASFNTMKTVMLKNRTTVMAVIFLSIVADIFLIPDSSDLRTFAVLGVYVASVRFYKLKSKATFLLCLALLGFMYILFLLTQASVKTEKAAVWLVLFWLVGIIQQWRE